ncbi:uncharacterized protein LOC119719945 [Patiria miniata]|uniref:L-dopachrome isomerase n=1 Tax=Patiria miniata TaxID=46514 RepID=A0A913Z114_PATMI|nr:uncharacterized protein LOC119719945 [Patiria miniata]
MPVLEIHTSLSADVFASDFHVKLVEVAASIFNRPQNVMVVALSTDERLYAGAEGSDPVFLLRVSNADAFQDVDENRKIIKAFSDFLTEKMAVPENSIRIILVSCPSTCIGLKGVLLADVIQERQKARETEQEQEKADNPNPV